MPRKKAYHLGLDGKKIGAMYRKGASSVSIAKRLGCNHSVILGHLERQGIPRRPQVPKFNQAEIVRLYQDGLGTAAIATRLRCNRGTVKWWLRSTPKRDRSFGHQRGPAHYNWRGGRWMTRGYVKVRMSDGHYIFEHRHVVEQHLQRKLDRKELVHHKNGIKHDNRIENLMVVSPQTHETHTRTRILEARIRELEAALKATG